MKTFKRMLVALIAMAMMLAGVSALAFAASSPTTTNISKASISLSATSYTYDGKSHSPSVTLTYAGEKLVKGTDYKVTVEKGTTPGEYSVKVTGLGLFEGTATQSFKITKASLENAAATAESVTYNGKARTAKLTVTDANGNTLVQDTDYTVSDATYADAGTYTVTITGKGNYKGQTTASFKIGKANINRAEVSVDSVVYDGTKQTAQVTVTGVDGTVLTKGKDYTVTDASYTEAGTYKITIAGKDNYMDSREVDFKIGKASIAKDAVSVSVKNVTYNGSEQTAKVTVTGVDGKTLTEGKDYTVTNAAYTDAGTYTITIAGKDNYGSSREASFTVKAADIDNAKVSVKDVTYNGSKQTAKVTVKGVDGKVLTEGTDYKVTNAAYTEAGTYKVTITGLGNYKNSCKESFTIKKADIGDAKVSVKAVSYNGSKQTAQVTVTGVDGKVLTAGKDYKVTNASYTEAGTYKVTITGLDNYSGSCKEDFKIGRASISRAKVSVKTVTYNGSKQTAKVTVTDLDGTVLTAGTDYTVTNATYTEAGTYKVTITGLDNYMSSREEEFKISQASVAKLKVSANSVTYTGKAQTPTITVKTADGKTTLKAGQDYTVQKVSQTAAGTYKVKVTGKGNYSGSTTVNFVIKKAAQSVTATAAGKTALTVKASALKKSAQTYTVKVSNAKGTVTYTTNSSNVTVKNGKITIAKGTKAGTYKVTVKVAATANYEAAKNQVITITVK